MPLVNENNPFIKFPGEVEENVQILPDDYKHSVVDTKKMPLASLLVHIEGIPARMDYYSQTLSSDDELHDYNPTYSGPDQQYHLIKDVEMKLQGGLNSSFSDEENRVTITGSALTYPGLKPNQGDVIILDIGDGRAGQFTVTNVTQRSMYKNTLYEIDFALREIMTAEIEYTLNENVIKTSYFDKDFLTYGQNPVITTKARYLKGRLEQAKKDILGSWAIEFYSYKIQSIQVPTKHGIVYDPFITNLMVNTFGSEGHPILSKVNTYNTGSQVLDGYLDIWNAIIKGEEYILQTAFNKYKLVDTRRNLRGNIYLRPIRFSAITHVLLPHIRHGSTQDPLNVFKYSVGGSLIDSGTITQEMLNERVEKGIDTPSDDEPLSYVASQNLYDLNGEGLSAIEEEVRRYFKQLPVDHDKILLYVDNRHLLTPLERFYLMPLCLLMLIHCLRSM